MGYSSALDLRQLSGVPNDPPSGTTLLYVKSDGLLYKKTLSVESPVDTTGSGVPTGCIMGWPSASPPAGWLLCNGQSTTGFPSLAAIVGATVPDYTGRFLVGAGVTTPSNTNRALNATGGADQVSLTVAQLASHDHGIAHNHSFLVRSTSGTTGAVSMGAGVAQADQNVSAASNTTSGSRGGDGAHENMPPFAALNWIIKT